MLLALFALWHSLAAFSVARHGLRMQAELQVAAIIGFALVGLQALLFELVELAKVFFSSERSSPSRMLVDIQLVELTRRIRPHDLL